MIDAADRKRERDRKRISNMTPAQIERKQERNARRLWAGETYVGTADSLERAELLNAHVARRLFEFTERQALERAAWRESERSTPLPDAGRSGGLRIVIRSVA